MPKVTLDRAAFKALASDTRLDILRTLDKKKMSLSEISRETELNKATLHEHLSKLIDAGLVNRKSREGHKWVYYQLSWKGESLLHPENTKIVVMFVTAVFALFIGISQMSLFLIGSYKQPLVRNTLKSYDHFGQNESSGLLNTTQIPNGGTFGTGGETITQVFYQDPIYLYLGILFLIICIIIACVTLWYRHKNLTPKL